MICVQFGFSLHQLNVKKIGKYIPGLYSSRAEFIFNSVSAAMDSFSQTSEEGSEKLSIAAETE